MDENMMESLLDMMVKEKYIKKISDEYQKYIPVIEQWKLRRARKFPGVGMTEDSLHSCTLDCITRRWAQTIVPGKVYGCFFSGVIHVCKRDSNCIHHFTDSEGMKRCVFSGLECGISYSHSWAPHDLYDKKNTNGSIVSFVSNENTCAQESWKKDTSLLSEQTMEYASQKKDDMYQDMKDGWIIDINRELEQKEDKKINEKNPEQALEKIVSFSDAPVLSRKKRLVDIKESTNELKCENTPLNQQKEILDNINEILGKNTFTS